MSVNSSGSVERFILPAGGSKAFEVLTPGGTRWNVSYFVPVNMDLAGTLDNISGTVKLQTSEDGITYSDVANTTITVVPGGEMNVTGATGAFARFINTNAAGAAVLITARPLNRVQPVTLL
jgi:hypothetical protein